jgi:hypothetical protein
MVVYPMGLVVACSDGNSSGVGTGMDMLTEQKNWGGRSVNHTQSTSPTTQETLPVSPQNLNAHPCNIRKYWDIFGFFRISRSSSDSEIFGNIRKFASE